MKRLVLVLSVAAAFVAPSTASAQLKVSFPGLAEFAVDGTDIYLVESRTVKVSGGTWAKMRIVRRSFLDKSRTVLAEFPTSSEITSLRAGGGFVFAEVLDENLWADEPTVTTRVLRMARDGSGRTVLANGRKLGDESGLVLGGGRLQISGCGTEANLMAASATGSAVIATNVAERESPSCGRKPNRDHWRYFTVSPDGSSSEVLKVDSTVNVRREKSGISYSDGAGYSIAAFTGQRVVLTSGTKSWVRDLISGQLYGPFLAPRSRGWPFRITSASPEGNVAISGVAFSKRSGRPYTRLFNDLANPTLFKNLPGNNLVRYCGSKLVSLTEDGIVELDRVSLTPVRTIVARIRLVINYGDIGCDSGYLYLQTEATRKASTIRAYAL